LTFATTAKHTTDAVSLVCLAAQPPRNSLYPWRVSGKKLQRFLQLRFHDFNVRSHKKRVEKLQYMHMNPVKRGLVGHPQHWPWSSFSFYASRKTGLIRIDPVQ
jgi:hypothetical protein